MQGPTTTNDPAQRGEALLAESSGVSGCARWDVTVSGENRIAVVPVPRPECGPIRPVIVGSPTFHRPSKTVRLPIALATDDGSEVRAPAFLLGWPDSLRVVSPPGLAGPAGPDRLLSFLNHDSVAPTAGPSSGARVWRFDDRVQLPEGRSRMCAGSTSQFILGCKVSRWQCTLWQRAVRERALRSSQSMKG